MCARMAAEQMRSTAARAVFSRTFRKCFAQGFMRCEPEIIVACKADDLASVHRHVSGAGAVGDASATTQTVALDIGETLFQRLEKSGRCKAHAASDNVASKTVRVRSASSASSSSLRIYGGIR